MKGSSDSSHLHRTLLIAIGVTALLAVGIFVVTGFPRRPQTAAQPPILETADTATPPFAPSPTRTPAPPSPSTGPATRTPKPTSTRTPALATPTPAPPASPSMPAPTTAPTVASTLTPRPIVRILAPAIGLDAPVVEVGWVLVEQDGEMRSEWETAAYAAGHHKNSAYPGHGGNIVLSGHHNIKGEVFRYLVDLEPGDPITLITEDGAAYTYQVVETLLLAEANATEEQRRANAQYIAPTDEEQLTLVTCWPYWTNTHRLIVIAKPAPVP